MSLLVVYFLLAIRPHTSTTCTACGLLRPPLEAQSGLFASSSCCFFDYIVLFRLFFQSTTFQYTSNLAPLFAVVFTRFTGRCVINLQGAVIVQFPLGEGKCHLDPQGRQVFGFCWFHVLFFTELDSILSRNKSCKVNDFGYFQTI